MNIRLYANPAVRAAYLKNQTETAVKQPDVSPAARTQDEVSISPEAREALAKQTAQAQRTENVTATEETADNCNFTSFTSFAEEFDRVTQDYLDTVRAHYADGHAENLTYDDPSYHAWDKYKNTESPCFCGDLPPDERAWAYDMEMDLLRGGRHLQLLNPYAFPDGAPTLESAALEANRACREQISQSIQDIFDRNNIDLPKDASFRLTVDPSYTIRVSGLQNKELTAEIEKALNCGDNGKNLYNHLKVTSPNGGTLGVNYADGRLETTDSALTDQALAEIKKQNSETASHYFETYDPHQGPLEPIGGYQESPWFPSMTPERSDRADSAIRLGWPEFKLRTDAEDRPPVLIANNRENINPLDLMGTEYSKPAADLLKTIEDYFNAENQKNSEFPIQEAVELFTEKSKLTDSPLVRAILELLKEVWMNRHTI